MQVNSINNQNSFGLKFSPRFKNKLRELAIEIFSKDEDKIFGRKYTPKVRDVFEKRVQKLKNMMPDAEIDIVDRWKSCQADIIGLKQHIVGDAHYYPYLDKVPTFENFIVLKRKDMPDKVVDFDTYNLSYPMGIQYLIKNIERIEQEEQTPVMKAAIDRMKKLLP